MMLDIEPYTSISEANAYFSTRLNSENWDEADVVDQTKALKSATRRINRLRFKGYKTGMDQQYNQFPRSGEIVIPESIKIATCEIAIELLGDFNDELEVQNMAFVRNEYASIKTEADTKVTLDHLRAGIPSALAWSYLKPYLLDPFSLTLSRPRPHRSGL